jgi:ABC-type transporter Mla subunit MlaD
MSQLGRSSMDYEQVKRIVAELEAAIDDLVKITQAVHEVATQENDALHGNNAPIKLINNATEGQVTKVASLHDMLGEVQQFLNRYNEQHEEIQDTSMFNQED